MVLHVTSQPLTLELAAAINGGLTKLRRERMRSALQQTLSKQILDGTLTVVTEGVPDASVHISGHLDTESLITTMLRSIEGVE